MLKGLIIFIFLTSFAFAKDELLSVQEQSRISFFMNRQIDIIKTNQRNFKRLLKRVAKDQIIGLELVIAAAEKSQVESRFGHTMLRFVDSYGVAGDDIVLSFVADLDSSKLSARRGIFGGYSIYPLLKTFRMFNREYIKQNDRSLERHVIPSTKQMRLDLINTLKKSWDELVINQENLDKTQSKKAFVKANEKGEKILKDKGFDLVALQNKGSGTIYAWSVVESIGLERKVHHIEPVDLKVASTKTFGKYKFMSNNCAGALIKFLKTVRFPSRGSLLWAGRIPVKIPIYFEKSMLNPFPKMIVPSFKDFKKKVLGLLNLNSEEIKDLKKWPINAASKLNKNLTVSEKLKLLDNLYELPQFVEDILKLSLPSFRVRPRYDEIYGLTTLDKKMYDVCENLQCIQDIKLLSALKWSKSELDYKKSRHKKIIKKIKKKKLKDSLKVRPKLVKHYLYLFSGS